MKDEVLEFAELIREPVRSGAFAWPCAVISRVIERVPDLPDRQRILRPCQRVRPPVLVPQTRGYACSAEVLENPTSQQSGQTRLLSQVVVNADSWRSFYQPCRRAFG